MKKEKEVRSVLSKARGLYFDKTRQPGEWRTAFDQGVLQALAWCLDVGESPLRGLELRLVREPRPKRPSGTRI